MSSPAIQRALIHQRQNRHADAVKELHQHLTQSPRDALAHAMLADSLVELEQFDDAQAEAAEAIGLAPDEAFGHAAMAHVLQRRYRYKSAEAAIRQAIALDSDQPSYFSTLGSIQLDLRKWAAARDAADRGLAIDPKHSNCLNIRGMALTQLGQREAASQTMENALADNPENAFTHANHGWTLLHRNKPREAMEHFREALRLDPTMQFAKSGIVEAMKARNPFYRLMLRYFLFMSRMDRRVQWGILIGGYFGYQWLRQFADTHPDSSAYVWPFLWLYIGFALSKWLSSTLFNLVLRFHPFGKYVLSEEQRLTSTLTAVTLAAAAGFGITHWRTGSIWSLAAAFGALGWSLPLTMLMSCHKGWPRILMGGILLVLLGIITTVTIGLYRDAESDSMFSLFQVFAYGCLFSQFAVQGLNTIQPKR